MSFPMTRIDTKNKNYFDHIGFISDYNIKTYCWVMTMNLNSYPMVLTMSLIISMETAMLHWFQYSSSVSAYVWVFQK